MADQLDKKDSYMRSDKPVTAPYTTTPTFLKRWAEEFPNDDAFRIHELGKPVQRITHEELYSNASRFAKGLKRLGIEKGDMVGLCGNTSIEHLMSLYGVQMARAKPLNLTLHTTDGSDLQRLINVIGSCKLLIFDPGHGDKNLDIIRRLACWDLKTGVVTDTKISGLRWIVLQSVPENVSDCLTIQTLFYNGDDVMLPQLDPDDTATIMWTSGSTGEPKAVEFSHYSILFIAHESEEVFKGYETNKRPVVFNDRPFFWIGGYPFWETVTGGTRISTANLLSFANPSEVIDFTITILRKEKIDRAFILISFLNELLKRGIKDLKIGSIVTGGQPVSSKCLEGVGILFDNLFMMYASTETGVSIANIFTSSTKTTEKYLGGKPIAGVEVKIVGNDGRMVKQNEKGEIYIRTPSRFNGYINNDEKTKAAITGCGWYKTDDVGHINADGCLEISGRVSDMMNISGVKIAPFYIETAISKHPDVQNCVVFAIENSDADDNIPCAVVQMLPGKTVTKDELIQILRDDLKVSEDAALVERCYIPKSFIFVDKIPKTKTGKNDRNQTRDTYFHLLNN